MCEMNKELQQEAERVKLLAKRGFLIFLAILLLE